LIERGSEATTSQIYERWDNAFHAKIAGSVRNSLFESLFQVIQAVRVEQEWKILRARSFKEGLRDQLVTQHLQVVDAIASRDPDAAESTMRKHLTAVSHSMRV